MITSRCLIMKDLCEKWNDKFSKVHAGYRGWPLPTTLTRRVSKGRTSEYPLQHNHIQMIELLQQHDFGDARPLLARRVSLGC